MNKFGFIMVGLVVIFFSGCAFDATVGKFQALSDPARITQYSGGVEVGQWCSTGKVGNESQTDGYFFKPSDGSSPVIEVSGDIRVEYGHPDCQ